MGKDVCGAENLWLIMVWIWVNRKVPIKARMHLDAIPGMKLVCIIFELFPLIHMTNQEQRFVCLSGT